MSQQAPGFGALQSKEHGCVRNRKRSCGLPVEEVQQLSILLADAFGHSHNGCNTSAKSSSWKNYLRVKYIPFPIGFVKGVLGAVGAIVRQVRNRKVNEALIQGVETARAVRETTPQGQAADVQFVRWLMEHQKEAGVFTTVSTLVDTLSSAYA